MTDPTDPKTGNFLDGDELAVVHRTDRLLRETAERETAWQRTRRLRYLVSVALGLVLLVVVAVVSTAVWQNVHRIDALSYGACREGNLANGYIRLVLDETRGFDPAKVDLPDPDDVLPILSCRESIEAGRPVRLRADEEAHWLRVFKRGRLPLVDHGHVVGSESLPAPKRRAALERSLSNPIVGARQRAILTALWLGTDRAAP